MPAVPLVRCRPPPPEGQHRRRRQADSRRHRGSASTAAPSPCPAAVRMGHKFAVAADQGRRPGPQVRPDHRLRRPRHRRRASTSTSTTSKLGTFERDYAFCAATPAPLPPPAEYRTFMGYDRGPGQPDHLRYGTRNYIAIISTVNCSASTSKYIAERVRAAGHPEGLPERGRRRADHPQAGLRACSTTAPDHQQLDRTLAGFARHPNVGGVHPRRPRLRDRPGDRT